MGAEGDGGWVVCWTPVGLLSRTQRKGILLAESSYGEYELLSLM